MNVITFSNIFTQEINKSHSQMACHSYQMKQNYPKAEYRGYTTLSTNKKEIYYKRY